MTAALPAETLKPLAKRQIPGSPAGDLRETRQGNANAGQSYQVADARGIGADCSTRHYGATQDEWDTLAVFHAPDMLPVVSKPTATVSPNSDLQTLGKTPSQYNASGYVVGLATWTKRISTERDIERWSANPDYGICLQTREVRAIDIDVADAELSSQIQAAIVESLGFEPPRRYRDNSAKCLFALTIKGDYTKRILRTEQTTGELDKQGNPRNPRRHIIEFLATGQQFIAAGTHPSGARYEWDGGMPMTFPEISGEQFEALWAMLLDKFGHESTELRESVGVRTPRKASDADDPMIAHLYDKWEVRGEDRSGRVDIRCPFEHEHTTDSGPSATSYFPAGVGKFQRGHFKCLHAHCADRSDHDFITAIGNPVADMFSVIEGESVRVDDDISDLFGESAQSAGGKLQSAPCGLRIELPERFARDKNGLILGTAANIALALEQRGFSRYAVGFDTFQDDLMIAPAGTNQWERFADAHYVALKIDLYQKGFPETPSEKLRECVWFVAERSQFDSAQVWAEALPPWDGTPRIARFCPEYLFTEDSPYTQAAGRYIWTALAGRVLEPGIKADMMPILVGPQGAGKSTAVRAMAPSEETFAEIDFSTRDDDQSRAIRGVLVAEVAELKGLHSRDIEAVKAFVTRTHESWVPKYREFKTKFPRRLVFIGTTNEAEFLSDPTGNRRFLPLQVEGVCDWQAIQRDRDQLWAEGIARFKEHGIAWHEVEQLARAEHDKFRIRDQWESAVREWLHTPPTSLEFRDESDPDGAPGATPAERPHLTSREVLREALGYKDKEITRRDEMRISKVLTALGYENKRMQVNGAQAMRWVKKP